jgi:hypothetical protein
MATYPDNLASFTAVRNGEDTVQAQHVNVAYEEISATQTELGTNAADRSGAWSATPLVISSLSFSDVKSRIDNVENGAYYSQTSLVNKAGGTTITPSTSSTKGLIIKGAASQSAHLLEFQVDGSTTAISYFRNDGTFFTPTIDGGTA